MSPDRQSEERVVGGLKLNLQDFINKPTQRFITKGVFSNEDIDVASYNGERADGTKVFEIEINNPEYEFFMLAKWCQQDKDVPNVIQFDLKTQDPVNNSQSKDFYAGDFVDAFMYLLDKLNHPVDNVRFSWQGPYVTEDTKELVPASINFTEYEEALAAGFPSEEAVLKTWTGRRIASKYGLTELRGEIQGGHSYSGILTRPELT